MKSPCLPIGVVIALAVLLDGQGKSDERVKPPPSAADPMRGKAPGEIRDDNGLKRKLVWCPPGFLTMEQFDGFERIVEPAVATIKPLFDDDDPKERPLPKVRTIAKTTRVKVYVTQGYWLGKFEVTQSEWKDVMNTAPWKGHAFTEEGGEFPATFVSWEDAVDFCRKLTNRERESGRLPDDWEYTLPTEAQWERACRARTESKFCFGDSESKLGDYAWFYGNSDTAGERFAHKVGQKIPNAWGLCDMHGNVLEWCRDSYSENLPGGRDPEVKPDAKTDRSLRVSRGGGWSNDAAFCESAVRRRFLRSDRGFMLGFRLALSPVPLSGH